MISYAVSLASFGNLMTSQLAEAFRKSRLKNVEVAFFPYTEDTEESRSSFRMTRELIKDGTICPVSVHLPFYGGGKKWDPSELNETERKAVVERFAAIIRDHADLLAPHLTLHASNEPPLEEHPVRIDQACQTIKALLPLADEYNFSINVEFLPRTCIGNTAEELLAITSRFDAKHVGICMDVNHVMDRWRELPDIITALAPRIRTFHINDYDGVDEMHWFPGQGIIDWCEVMKRIKAIEHDVVLIHETVFQLGTKVSHIANPYFALRQTEKSCWFLENCDSIIPAQDAFRIPGNE